MSNSQLQALIERAFEDRAAIGAGTQGEVREAVEIFERVNPKSERYTMAMYYAGQNYMRLYITEKAKPENTRNNDEMSANRGKAIERLKTGLEILKKQYEPSKPLP